MQYGSFKYSEEKYGATKNLIANTTTSAIITKGSMFSKQLIAYVSSSAVIVRRTTKSILANIASTITMVHTRIRKYVPVYPILSFTEYLIDLSYTDYPIALSFTEYVIDMGVSGVPIAGGTITLNATFPSSAGTLAELANVTAKVYGPGRTLLATTVATVVSEGVYSAEYTIPATTIGQFDYEFSGTLGTKTITTRSSFDSIWK